MLVFACTGRVAVAKSIFIPANAFLSTARIGSSPVRILSFLTLAAAFAALAAPSSFAIVFASRSPSTSKRRWLSELSTVANAGSCRVRMAGDPGDLAVPVQLNGILVTTFDVVLDAAPNPFVGLNLFAFFSLVLDDAVVIFDVPCHALGSFPLLP